MSDIDTSTPFPTAQVTTYRSWQALAQKLSSRLWFITLLCFGLAIALVWAEFHFGGIRIEINFADGNGLVPGDVVRYRGIEVGEVTSVVLHPDLDRVAVTVELNAESAALAREGTRFWIERPDIRLGQIRGLDTLVGGRYVGVLPGPSSATFASSFEGLPDPPATLESDADGLEIVLISGQRLGLQRGSPLSYRGVEIGHVQSVGLATDSSGVIARTFIRAEYRSLVRENSKFWSNSGIDLKIGIQGLELDAETLATIAAGGVAMATPDSPGSRVTTGHRFELVKSPRDEWLRWHPQLAIGSAILPDGVTLPQPILGVKRGKKTLGLFSNARRGWLLPLDGGFLLGPRDMLAADEEDDSLEIGGHQLNLQSAADAQVDRLALKKTDAIAVELTYLWPAQRIQPLKTFEMLPEELIITCGSDNTTLPLAKTRIQADEVFWRIDPQVPIDESWHGACVLSAATGKLVGILVVDDEKMLLQPIAEQLLTGASKSN